MNIDFESNNYEYKVKTEKFLTREDKKKISESDIRNLSKLKLITKSNTLKIQTDNINDITLIHFSNMIKFFVYSLDIQGVETTPGQYSELLQKIKKGFDTVEQTADDLFIKNQPGRLFESNENPPRKIMSIKKGKDNVEIEDYIPELTAFTEVLISMSIFLNPESNQQFIESDIISTLRKINTEIKENKFLNYVNGLKTVPVTLRSTFQYYNSDHPIDTLSRLSNMIKIKIKSNPTRTVDISMCTVLIKGYIQCIFFLYYMFYKLRYENATPKGYPDQEKDETFSDLIKQLTQLDFTGENEKVIFFKILLNMAVGDEHIDYLQKNMKLIIETISPIIGILRDIRSIFDLLPQKHFPPAISEEGQTKGRVLKIIDTLYDSMVSTEEYKLGSEFHFDWQLDFISKVYDRNITVNLETPLLTRIMQGGFTSRKLSPRQDLQFILRVILPEHKFLSLMNWVDYCHNGVARWKPKVNIENMFTRAEKFG